MYNHKITLYISTHNDTGLKYFGKTTKYFTEIELQENYHGSGTYWKRHLDKHGDNVTMQIYGIYNEDEIEDIALKFSNDNDIVNSKNWANLILENGLNGWCFGDKHTEESKEKMRGISKEFTDEHKKKLSLASKNQIRPKCSKETKEKIRNSNKGQIRSEELKKKLSVVAKNRPTVICPHCNKSGKHNAMKQWHFDNCKEKL